MREEEPLVSLFYFYFWTRKKYIIGFAKDFWNVFFISSEVQDFYDNVWGNGFITYPINPLNRCISWNILFTFLVNYYHCWTRKNKFTWSCNLVNFYITKAYTMESEVEEEISFYFIFVWKVRKTIRKINWYLPKIKIVFSLSWTCWINFLKSKIQTLIIYGSQ